jgi:hypothetical protein
MSKQLQLPLILGVIASGYVPLTLLADEPASKTNTKAAQTEPAASEAQLGIGVAALPEVLTSHLPDVIKDGRGILVSEVIVGSPAEKAGLEKHDVMVRYDDQDLYSPEQLVKRVRNEAPGKSVALQYLRAGTLNTVKLTLGEQSKKESVFADWPGFSSKLRLPWSPLRPEFWTEVNDISADGTEWTAFESLSVEKGEDGTYVVRIAYKDTSGNSVAREFKGTRQEIRDSIKGDNDLPDSRKKQLNRTLDDRGSVPLTQPAMPNWNRELFNWPNVDF